MAYKSVALKVCPAAASLWARARARRRSSTLLSSFTQRLRRWARTCSCAWPRARPGPASQVHAVCAPFVLRGRFCARARGPVISLAPLSHADNSNFILDVSFGALSDDKTAQLDQVRPRQHGVQTRRGPGRSAAPERATPPFSPLWLGHPHAPGRRRYGLLCEHGVRGLLRGRERRADRDDATLGSAVRERFPLELIHLKTLLRLQQRRNAPEKVGLKRRLRKALHRGAGAGLAHR